MKDINDDLRSEISHGMVPDGAGDVVSRRIKNRIIVKDVRETKPTADSRNTDDIGWNDWEDMKSDDTDPQGHRYANLTSDSDSAKAHGNDLIIEPIFNRNKRKAIITIKYLDNAPFISEIIITSAKQRCDLAESVAKKFGADKKQILTELDRLAAAHVETIKRELNDNNATEEANVVAQESESENINNGSIGAQARYFVENGRTFRRYLDREGEVKAQPIANFAATIVAELTLDDGVERSKEFEIEGILDFGEVLPRITVQATEFSKLDWITEKWGTRAIVEAGRFVKEHLRCAIQVLSTCVKQMHIHTNTGWHSLEDGQRVYLHGGGAIGTDGPLADIEVALPPALANFKLPTLGTREENVHAVRTSLRLLNGLAPDAIVFPVFAGVYRAVLGPSDVSINLCGPTGVFKSEVASIGQCHFGSGFDARHLPTSWSSTPNSIEMLQFVAKDALIVIDDFAPGGSFSDIARFHRDAERIFRAQGNNSGRQRLFSDGRLRPCKPPRGSTMSTGEDLPLGQSVRARIITVEVSPNSIDKQRLTESQSDASKGRYALAMAAYIQWLASRIVDIQKSFRRNVESLRDRILRAGHHARMPEAVAQLIIGLQTFLQFAVDIRAIDEQESSVIWHRGLMALVTVGRAQRSFLEGQEPVQRFLSIIRAAIAAGNAHLAEAPNGGHPDNAEGYGWRLRTLSNGDTIWDPMGDRVGWIVGNDLLLEPNAAFTVAQRIAHTQGQPISISQQVLHKRLFEKGVLFDTEKNRGYKTRRWINGIRTPVLALRLAVLGAMPTGQSGSESAVDSTTLTTDD